MERASGNKLKILFVSILTQNSNPLFVQIVRKFVIDNRSTITPDSTIQDIMVHVMKREQKIYAFYDHMLKVATSIPVRNLFEELAAEK